MKRIISLLMIAFIFPSLLMGCWDKRELNELAIATGLGIDKSERGYKLSAQIVNPDEVSPQANASGITPVTVHIEEGETMYEAIRKLSLTNPRRMYGSHLRLLVISEEVAKEGIEDALDYLSRDKDFRADFSIVIAKESKAEDILKVQTITEKIPANDLHTLLETSREVWGGTVTVNFRKLLDMLTIPGRNPVISGIKVKGDLKVGETKANTESSSPPAKFDYIGLGVFHKDKLVGWLNEEDGKGYNYITDEIANSVVYINCPSGGKMSIELMRSKTKKHVKIGGDHTPEIELDVRIEANVGETSCSVDLASTSEINELERLFENEITKIIDKTIENVQKEYKIDIFGFGEEVYRSYPNVWKEISEDWEEHFAELDVQVKVNVNIKQLGTIGNSFKQNMEE